MKFVRGFWPKSITNFGERQSTSFAESGNFAEKTVRKIDPISPKTNRKYLFLGIIVRKLYHFAQINIILVLNLKFRA